MRSLLARLRGRAARLRRDDSGSSSIEFVILFPLIMTIFLSGFESGYLMVRNVMLERSVDLTVRDLRLGTPMPTDPDELQEHLRQQICAGTFFMPDCGNRLTIEIRTVSMTTWGVLPGPPTCTNMADPGATLHPDLSTGEGNQLLLLRVCAMFDPMFPMQPLGLAMRRVPRDDDPNRPEYALVVTTAYVNEPR